MSLYSNLGVFQQAAGFVFASIVTTCQYNSYGFSRLVAIPLVPPEPVKIQVHRACLNYTFCCAWAFFGSSGGFLTKDHVVKSG